MLKLWRRLWDLSLFFHYLLCSLILAQSVPSMTANMHGMAVTLMTVEQKSFLLFFILTIEMDPSECQFSKCLYHVCLFLTYACCLFVSYLRLWKKWKETNINRGITVTGYHWMILYSFWIFVVTITAGI